MPRPTHSRLYPGGVGDVLGTEPDAIEMALGAHLAARDGHPEPGSLTIEVVEVTGGQGVRPWNS